MAKGKYISINTDKIGDVSLTADKAGKQIETTRTELKALQKKLTSSQNLLQDHYGVCFDKAVPTSRLKEQKELVDQIVELFKEAADLAQSTTNDMNKRTSALQLALKAMNYSGSTVYTTSISAITALLAKDTDCGDDYAYVGKGGEYPVYQGAKITSTYGPRNLFGSFHYGIDLNTPTGTELKTIVSGKVVKAYTQTGGGKCIYILGDDGYVYEFAHLSEFNCKTGDRVEAGQLIGKTGKSGQNVTGPHLHLGIYDADKALNKKGNLAWKKKSDGQWYIDGSIDPEQYLADAYDIKFERRKK